MLFKRLLQLILWCAFLIFIFYSIRPQAPYYDPLYKVSLAILVLGFILNFLKMGKYHLITSLIGTLRSAIKLIIIVMLPLYLLCFLFGITHSSTTNESDTLMDGALALSGGLFILGCRDCTRSWVESFKHQDYFMPAKKYEYISFNFYFGIDHRTGNILYADRYRSRAVLIEWGSWKRYYRTLFGLVLEFCDMGRDNLMMKMWRTQPIMNKIADIYAVQDNLAQTPQGAWAEAVAKPKIAS